MQINRFTEIVVFVTSLGFTFFGCIAPFVFYFAFLLFILLTLLECAGEFRSCGSDHGLCPLDSHKPLKRLDRNFYMDALLLLFRSSGFVLCCDRGGTPFYSLQQTSNRRPPKKIKIQAKFSPAYFFIENHFIFFVKECIIFFII